MTSPAKVADPSFLIVVVIALLLPPSTPKKIIPSALWLLPVKQAAVETTVLSTCEVYPLVAGEDAVAKV